MDMIFKIAKKRVPWKSYLNSNSGHYCIADVTGYEGDIWCSAFCNTDTQNN